MTSVADTGAHDEKEPVRFAEQACSTARVTAAATVVWRDHPAMNLDDIVALFDRHLEETESAPVQDYRLVLAERRVRAVLATRAATGDVDPDARDVPPH